MPPWKFLDWPCSNSIEGIHPRVLSRVCLKYKHWTSVFNQCCNHFFNKLIITNLHNLEISCFLGAMWERWLKSQEVFIWFHWFPAIIKVVCLALILHSPCIHILSSPVCDFILHYLWPRSKTSITSHSVQFIFKCILTVKPLAQSSPAVSSSCRSKMWWPISVHLYIVGLRCMIVSHFGVCLLVTLLT